MRIGIDIRSLQNDSQNRGIGTYTRCLLKNILSKDRSNEYVFFAFADTPLPTWLKEGVFKDIRIRKVVLRKIRFGSLLGQALFPYAIKQERLDIFHSHELMLPVLSSAKKIITVHDFIMNDFAIYKKTFNIIAKAYLYLKDETLKHADKIIAVSEYTKKKVMELIGIREERIQVIYEATDEMFKPENDQGLFMRIKEKYGFMNDFLLYVGAIDYHKNIDGLIKAFSNIRSKDISLVLAGVKANIKYFDYICRLIEKLKIKERVYILGHVAQEDLVPLYNMAKIVISASFYEGFGLPILEAMACARPVIASGNTSMKEIVGSSGILVDPYNIEEVTYAIENLLSDDALMSLLSRKALSRAREFNWEKTAGETLLLYEDLLR